MLKKFATDLKSPKVRYNISNDLHSNLLKYYYFVFEEERVSAGKDQALISKWDNNGIPLNKTYIDVKDKKYVYFPITIGQVGLAVFHTYLKTKSESDKQRFLKFVDWFYENSEITDNLGVRWLTDVSLPQYKNPGPWQSAFSQGRGISILLRGYQLTGNKKYAEMTEKALIPFTKPVSEGGVTSFTKWGPFYEEYTAEVPTLVLNGMIFSLCGVYDFARVFLENKLAKKIFDEGIQTLKNTLPEYDLGYWSRYNLCKADWYPEIDPATIGYQRLHITQLEMLYRLTNEEIFKKYAEIFKEQDNLLNAIRMYVEKYKSLKKLNRL
ncbi:MAG: hypothetical protein ISS28_02285 [Candidatus Cloacimonetes bacterium]|nr:hypothetical protein [Candidatus Cloacimonadota bacterium]MBL7085917.1 hypothetical protein [Candidatus Cloacimonadota bacterium]